MLQISLFGPNNNQNIHKLKVKGHTQDHVHTGFTNTAAVLLVNHNDMSEELIGTTRWGTKDVILATETHSVCWPFVLLQKMLLS